MKKKQRIWSLLAVLACVGVLGLGYAGCTQDSQSSSTPSSTEISSVLESASDEGSGESSSLEDSSNPSGGSISTPDFEF